MATSDSAKPSFGSEPRDSPVVSAAINNRSWCYFIPTLHWAVVPYIRLLTGGLRKDTLSHIMQNGVLLFPWEEAVFVLSTYPANERGITNSPLHTATCYVVTMQPHQEYQRMQTFYHTQVFRIR